jgi:hypothetical protein
LYTFAPESIILKFVKFKNQGGGKKCDAHCTSVLKHIAQNDPIDLITKKTLIRDFYMGDCLSGSHNIDSAKRLLDDLRAALANHKLNFKKIYSNSKELLKKFLPEILNEELDIKITNHLNDQKPLGLHWKPKGDYFYLKIQYRITTPQPKDNCYQKCLLYSIL